MHPVPRFSSFENSARSRMRRKDLCWHRSRFAIPGPREHLLNHQGAFHFGSLFAGTACQLIGSRLSKADLLFNRQSTFGRWQSKCQQCVTGLRK